MPAIRKYLPVFVSTLISVFFIACGGGGDDGAQAITPDNSGSELQRIAAEMQKGLEEYLGAQVDATVAAAASGSFDLSYIQLLLGSAQRFDRDWVPQKFNQWRLACTNPQIQPTTGLSPAACVNSFWHTLAALGMSTVVTPLGSVLPPSAQAAALVSVIGFANSNGSNVPPTWIASGQNYLTSLGF